MTIGFIGLSIAAFALCLVLGYRFKSFVVFLSSFILSLVALLVAMPSDQAFPDPDEVPPRIDSGADQESNPSVAPTNSTRADQRKETELTLTKLESFRPIELPSDGYVGSNACKECHQENHSTWKASYHRTMTQIADPDVVLGDFSGLTIQNSGNEYTMKMEEGVCSVVTPDPDHPGKQVSAPVVMTTGSHHMQVYWFATGKRRLLGMFPLVHLKETDEWIPRQSAFLVPPGIGASFEMGRWNDVCSSCHSTQRKGRRLASGEWDTHVGEFGISCEACHGPGQPHIAFHTKAGDLTPPDANVVDDPIVNPEDLPKVLSGQVCGQCHSVIDPVNMDLDYQERGHAYRPGRDLTATHSVWNRDSPEFERTRKTLDYPDLETLLNETYYADGMIRVSGREYNGLIESSCYLNGEMTCLSCHDLHKDADDPRSLTVWADDQLSPLALENSACTQCHDAQQYGATHTHHEPQSSGSKCYNCHMPHTAYGLLKAIRSHQISSPDVGIDRDAKRPNACNLCHLDRTLRWSSKHLFDWYDIEPPPFDEAEKSVAASILWVTRADAAQRAIAAWHMGWDAAQEASGNEWELPFLSGLLDDEYEAIRLISRRSIRSLPGGESLDLDVVTNTTSNQRQQKALQILSGWINRERTKEINRPELLILGKEGIAADQLRSLIDQRDHTPISLSE